MAPFSELAAAMARARAWISHGKVTVPCESLRMRACLQSGAVRRAERSGATFARPTRDAERCPDSGRDASIAECSEDAESPTASGEHSHQGAERGEDHYRRDRERDGGTRWLEGRNHSGRQPVDRSDHRSRKKVSRPDRNARACQGSKLRHRRTAWLSIQLGRLRLPDGWGQATV